MTRQGDYQGRPYNRTTRLGRIMWNRGHRKLYIFAAEVNISGRALTNYLNGRTKIRDDHLVILANKLNVPQSALLEVEDGGMEV